MKLPLSQDAWLGTPTLSYSDRTCATHSQSRLDARDAARSTPYSRAAFPPRILVLMAGVSRGYPYRSQSSSGISKARKASTIGWVGPYQMLSEPHRTLSSPTASRSLPSTWAASSGRFTRQYHVVPSSAYTFLPGPIPDKRSDATSRFVPSSIDVSL